MARGVARTAFFYAVSISWCALDAGRALAADTGNDACPAVALPADDVRDRYDDSARLTHELRIAKGHVRIARNYWHSDRLLVGECLLDGKRVGYVRYAYDDDGHVTEMDKRTFVASGLGAGSWARETTRNRYDADGQLIESELRGP